MNTRETWPPRRRTVPELAVLPCLLALLAVLVATPVQADWRDRLGWSGRKAVATFASWRESMFGVIRDEKPLGEENSDVPIIPAMNVPERFVISTQSPTKTFPEGESHYRLIELSREFAHVAIRLRVMAVPNADGRGNSVFKPILYVLDDDESVRESREAEPLLLDIQPFKRTRLLACVSLDKVRRFAIATPAKAVDTFYETRSRSKVKAPKTSYRFFYSTEPVKIRLPYKATGEMVLEVTREDRSGAGCDGQSTVAARDEKPSDDERDSSEKAER